MQKEWLWRKDGDRYRYVECEIVDGRIIPNWSNDSGAYIISAPGAIFAHNRYKWYYRGKSGKSDNLKDAQTDCLLAMQRN